MASMEEIKSRLKGVLSPKRFIHSINVMNTSIELANKFGEDPEKAAVAGILHDCARDIKGEELFTECKNKSITVNDVNRLQPELLHGVLGSKLARTDYGIDDDYILNAIKYHTTGCKNMSLLDKIIFIADYIEPNRSFPGVNDLRKLAFKDLDMCLIQALERTIKHVLSKGALIHPDTIDARNYLVLKRKINV